MTDVATLLAHIRIHPGSEARFEEISRWMYRNTHDHEDRVVRYEYWRGAEPGTYYCLESFPDLPGFFEHQTSDHHEEAGPQLREVIADMRLEWVDPMQGASPLAPTNPCDLPADANDLVKRAHARFSVLTDWWLALREAEGNH